MHRRPSLFAFRPLEARPESARRLIERRMAAGLTQVDLARRSGLNQSIISRVESGQSGGSPSTLSRIDRALAEAEAQR
jgi:predicted transcriptional regulator